MSHLSAGWIILAKSASNENTTGIDVTVGLHGIALEAEIWWRRRPGYVTSHSTLLSSRRRVLAGKRRRGREAEPAVGVSHEPKPPPQLGLVRGCRVAGPMSAARFCWTYQSVLHVVAHPGSSGDLAEKQSLRSGHEAEQRRLAPGFFLQLLTSSLCCVQGNSDIPTSYLKESSGLLRRSWTRALCRSPAVRAERRPTLRFLQTANGSRMRKATADPALAYREGFSCVERGETERTSSCGAPHHHTSLCGAHHPAVYIIITHIIVRRTSSCHPAAHIILLRTSSPHIIVRRTSSCGAHPPATHIIVRRTSSCGAHHPAAHIILQRTSSCGAHHRGMHFILRRTSSPHIIVRRTSSCGVYHHHPHHRAAHIIVPSCGAHHPVAHIITAHHRAAHIILRRTSSCNAHHRAPHIILRRTSSCGAHHPATHIILGRTSSPHIILRRTSSCSAYRTSTCGVHYLATHIILRHTSSCGAHHPEVHIILGRTSAHIVLRRTLSCCAHNHRTSSCAAPHRASHLYWVCTLGVDALKAGACFCVFRDTQEGSLTEYKDKQMTCNPWKEISANVGLQVDESDSQNAATPRPPALSDAVESLFQQSAPRQGGVAV
ncbi:unnamed protein product [Pleuronectes platessa]|uniref:Uncharacterized protein n=1 Tax=Pleuronectes platessa TaxID=8262 RepID=A0A9N7YQZ1_PLEPL|nr:unnamed protein product [Pleuronectes platessa]